MSANNGTLANIRNNMPSPAESRMAIRRANALAKFSDDDVQDILVGLKKKAIAGDSAAAKLMLAYLIGPPDQAPTNVNVDKVVFEQPAGSVPKSVAKSRQRIVELIALEGPMDAAKISARTGLHREAVESCLEHDWFEKEKDGWHITNAARGEVMGEDD